METKPHKLQVPRGDRTGQVIEPYLTDQWFVKMDALAKRGLELVESGQIQFVPPNWINTYRHWMEKHPGLVHQPSAVVGPSHSGMVRRCRALPCWPRRSRGACQAWLGCGDCAASGQRRAGNLVLLAAVAILHAGLAGFAGDGRARIRALSAFKRAGHRLRHHLLLGGAHDHGHRQFHRPGAVPRRLYHRPDPRCAGPEDVQVQGQRARSAGHHRRHQHRGSGGQAHQRLDAAAHGRKRSKKPRARNSRTASLPTVPTRCASPSPHSRRMAATSSSIWAAPRATRTSATSCGTPRVSC